MKNIFLVGILATILFCAPVWGETMYVSDILTITLRTGPGTGHKITKMLESGQIVDVIEESEEWAKVVLPNQTEGWVLKRYITPEKTSRQVLGKLGKKHEQLLLQFSSLQKENIGLKDENKRLKSELKESNKKLGTTSNDYQNLRKNSANFLTLEENHNKATYQLAQQTEKIEQLKEENWGDFIKAFLYGAGVLILGFIIGFASKRPSRRSSLL
jgi:SH3 domain protein